MNKNVSGQKCPSCETGRQTLLLDPREPFCPHLCLNKGNNCSMYMPITENEKLISKNS